MTTAAMMPAAMTRMARRSPMSVLSFRRMAGPVLPGPYITQEMGLTDSTRMYRGGDTFVAFVP